MPDESAEDNQQPTEYHIVDCGASSCQACPAAFRGFNENVAIQQAKSHEGKTDVVDIISV